MHATTRISGACPHCRARVESALLVSSQPGHCAACGGSFLAVLPVEEAPRSAAAAAGDGVDVQLLPLGPLRGLAAFRSIPRLRRQGLFVLGASAAALVVLLVLGGIAFWLPESRALCTAIARPLSGVVLLPLTVLLSRPAVHLFLRRASDTGGAWHASLVVAYGVTALVFGSSVGSLALGFLGPSRVAAAIAMLLVGVAPGLLVARLASAQPYRHAFAVVLTYALPLLLLAPLGNPSVSVARSVTWVLLIVAMHAALVLVGANVGVRLRRASVPSAR